MTTTEITGAEMLLRSLEAEGVDTVFGYPGGAIMPIYDCLLDHPNIKHILTRHEQGAVHAAQGYARVSSGVGVCMATSGPGATNLITGIADAMIDSTPIICIVAQVNATLLGTDAFQEADIINMTTPISKWNFQITHQDEITATIARAFHIARTGRPGPVVIEITRNAQTALGKFQYNHCKSIHGYNPKPEIDLKQINATAKLLEQSSKPLILAGQGIKISEAESALIALAEKSGTPIATTLMGLSAVPSDHHLNVGMVGMHGNVAANRMTQQADLIIAIGVRFSDRITGLVNNYAPKAQIVHIDIDPVELGKIIKPTIAICADAKQAIEALTILASHKDRKPWMKYAQEQYQKEWELIIKPNIAPIRDELTMAEIIDEIARQTDSRAIIVTDVGQQQMKAARYSRFRQTRSLITSGGLGTMGFGLPAAIGAAIAAPNRTVVTFIGDGGFQMTMQELGTIMQQKIPVKIVVLNNSFLGMVRQWQEMFWDKRYAMTALQNPDFTLIANAYKIPSAKLENRESIPSTVADMLAAETPYLIEAVVGKEDNVFPMIPAGASVSDLIFKN